MKIIVLLVLLPFMGIAQNIWYVDRDATGANTGRSWTDAWTTLDSSAWGSTAGVNWALISAGDTIYVSGGTDSTEYYSTSDQGLYMMGDEGTNYTYASGDPVIICPAWQANHNGDVYIISSANDQPRIMVIGRKSNIKITGFTFIDRRPSPTVTDALFRYGAATANSTGDKDSLIIFENNHVISAGYCGMMVIQTSKAIIRNNIFEIPYNNNSQPQDPFGMSSGRGGHTIDGNTIIMNNDNVGTGEHRDGIQISNVGFGEVLGGVYATERLTTTISNNLIIDRQSGGTGWNAFVYSSGMQCNQTFNIYNNILVVNKIASDPEGFWISQSVDPSDGPMYKYKVSTYLLNNTVIFNSRPEPENSHIVRINGIDTLVIKNNLFICDTTSVRLYDMGNSTELDSLKFNDVNYNLLALEGGVNVNRDSLIFVDADWHTYAEWQSTYGNDVNSITADSDTITFINKNSIDKSDYYTTTGRDSGVDLSATYPFLSTDILGNPRSGSWDIGALEYQDGAVDSLPNAFTFTDVTNANLSQTYNSNTITLAGFDSAYAYAGGQIYILNEVNQTGYVKVFPGDEIQLTRVSSGSYSTAVNTTLTVGSRSDTWTVTTKAAPAPSGNGGWIKQPNGRGIYSRDGKRIITR